MATKFNLIPVGLNEGFPIKQGIMHRVAVANREIVKREDRMAGWKLQVNVEDDQWVSFYVADSEPQSLANPDLPDCTVFLNNNNIAQFAEICDRAGVDVGSVCRTCGDRGMVLQWYDRGANSPPGNMYVGCPDCEQGRQIERDRLTAFYGEDAADKLMSERVNKEEDPQTIEEKVDEVLDVIWDDVNEALAEDLGWTPEQEEDFAEAVEENLKKEKE